MNLFLEKFQVPKDVALGLPIVRMIGQQELFVENYRGLLEYTDSMIRIQTKLGQIHITGKQLKITHYDSDEMKIKGIIHMFMFYQGGCSC